MPRFSPMDGLLGLSIPYLDQIELAFYFKLMTCWLVMMNDIVTKDMMIVAIMPYLTFGTLGVLTFQTLAPN